MRISAREACVRPRFHTRSEIKYITRTLNAFFSKRTFLNLRTLFLQFLSNQIEILI